MQDDEATPETGPPLTIKSRDVLIVEDNIIIAMAAEDLLTEMGFACCLIAASNREAQRVIEERNIGFAMIDINLGDETSEPIARLLLEQGIPFVFATGYGENPFDPELFGDVPTLTKPYSERDLLAAIEALTAR